jgi:hypothetical protein
LSFADKAITYFRTIKTPGDLPPGVQSLYPHRSPEVQEVIRRFFTRFYGDDNPRTMLIGINPGRFGAGITGINFTAPRQLLHNCGIPHPFGESSELSAEFIYEVIEAYGGAAEFFGKFYLGSVSPIGFVKDGRNLNYYDDPQLLKSIRPYALRQIKKQLSFGFQRRVALCIGGDKNYRFLHALNEEMGFFTEIRVLPHPRFVMQYRRSQKDKFIHQYLDELSYSIKK